MTAEAVPDLSRVMDVLTPEQNQMLDHWAEDLQGVLSTAVSQGGPAARRVKNLLKGRDARALSAADLGRLAFNPITHDHLDRLLALSCIVADPARFGVTLPELEPGRRLKTITLQSGMDIRLAARLAGVDPAAVGILLTQLGLARENLRQAIADKIPPQDLKRYG